MVDLDYSQLDLAVSVEKKRHVGLLTKATGQPIVAKDARFVLQEAVLRAHMLTHSDQRDFVCPWDGCEYAFKTKGSLKRHLRRHTSKETDSWISQ